MEEIIELIEKAQIKYKNKCVQITFWTEKERPIVGEIYNFDTDVSVFRFNSFEELRNHLKG